MIRAVCLTLRFRVDDRAGILKDPPSGSLIWAFWHNRVFSLPYVYRKFLPTRQGAVLTSPSGDGEIIAQVMRNFGVDAVRGSSNKRAAAALRELVSWVKQENDIVITPDGPRGPRYQLQPGIIKVAQLTKTPVFPVHVRYSKCFRLKSWDAFMIPWPFSRVDVTFGEYHQVARTRGDEEFETERLRLENVLKQTAD
ncbi:MAG: lysophospholipid acyltransferase (LPLAT)-like uncharacterized protein [Pseudoalteromonas tetraodonis]